MENEETLFSDIELLEDYIVNEDEAEDLVLMIARNFDEGLLISFYKHTTYQKVRLIV